MNLPGQLEAVLFVLGEPTTTKALGRTLDVPAADIERALDALAASYTERGAGVRLLRSPEGVQLVTAADAHDVVEKTIKGSMREKLTPAAAETLAIIAYRGPVTRAAVEAIRGVNSSFTLRLLALRGLVTRETHPADARRFVYQVSADFLRHLGVARLEDLPQYNELHAHQGMTRLAEDAEKSAGTDSGQQAAKTGE